MQNLLKHPDLSTNHVVANVQKLLDKLCSQVSQDGYEEFRIRRLRELVDKLQLSGVHSIDRFIKKLSKSIGDKQGYTDIFVEGQFAVTLANNGFSKIYIESCDGGPDIKASYNHQAIHFEVVRRRPNGDEWAESFDINNIEPDCPEDIISKIQDKLGQLLDGELNIVVYWSSTLKVMHPELRDAFAYIQQEIEGDPQRYDRLSGILFTEQEGMDLSTLKQFYLFTNHKASKPLGSRLASKLESLHTKPLKELQRQHGDLEEPYKRLHGKNT